MTRLATVLSVLLALAAGPPASGQDQPPALPNAPPPLFVLVVGVDRDKGTVKIESRIDVLVPRTVPREVVRNGVKVVEAVTEFVPETRTIQQQLLLKGWRVLDRDGKEVTGEDLWKRLTPRTMVLQQSGVLPVDPAYRRVLSRGALILAPRHEGKQPGPR
jgi:hypothetical protein